jgi:hypothetical protein
VEAILAARQIQIKVINEIKSPRGYKRDYEQVNGKLEALPSSTVPATTAQERKENIKKKRKCMNELKKFTGTSQCKIVLSQKFIRMGLTYFTGSSS